MCCDDDGGGSNGSADGESVDGEVLVGVGVAGFVFEHESVFCFLHSSFTLSIISRTCGSNSGCMVTKSSMAVIKSFLSVMSSVISIFRTLHILVR